MPVYRRWIVLLGLLLVGTVQAQSVLLYEPVYRPLGTQYLVFPSAHFDVIYEAGLEAEAREMAFVLEAYYDDAAALLGVERTYRMPVVLNGHNDRSNGFVTALPFKQEIEGISIKGNVLSTRFHSWVEAVGPHELVHAMQFNRRGGPGLGALLRPFVPDLARVFNLGSAGLAEGAAVYFESNLRPGAGRLNHALFTMRNRAAALEDRPWTLTQAMVPSMFSRPFNRHYLAGSSLYRLMYDEDEGRSFRKTLSFQYRLPFLGTGAALWLGGGRAPWTLNRQFKDAMRAEAEAEVDALGPLTEVTPLLSTKGRLYRRPRWLDAETLLVYAHGYALRPGLYRVEAATGQLDRLRHLLLTEDAYYSLDLDEGVAYGARYAQEPLTERARIADVQRVDLRTGAATPVTRGGRTMAAVSSPEGAVWMLQNDGQVVQWVAQTPDGLVPYTRIERGLLKEILPSPDGQTTAVLISVAGTQGLFTAQPRPQETTFAPWLVFEGATIFDASWSADGRFLLFSADLNGVANVYALDTTTDQIRQLTNVAFGAMEPSLSPDGTQLAFVHYEHERFELVVSPFAWEDAPSIPRRLARFGEQLDWTRILNTSIQTRFDQASAQPYRSLRPAYLRPRAWYPVLRYDFDEVDLPDEVMQLGLGVGIGVQGTDPLQRWTYAAEGFWQKDRPYGQATVQLGMNTVRPQLSLFSIPEARSFRIATSDSTSVVRRLGVQERGASLLFTRPVTFVDDVFLTRLSLSLQTFIQQERVFDDDGNTLRFVRSDGEVLPDFIGSWQLSPFGFFLWRLQQNPRDLIPNTGLVLSSTATFDLWNEARDLRAGAITRLNAYLPVFMGSNTGVRLGLGWLTQNQGGLYNLDAFLPTGYEDRFLGEGDFLRLDAEVVVPLAYPDRGTALIPFYLGAVYLYGLGEAVEPIQQVGTAPGVSSIGAGLGARVRVFGSLPINVAVGLAYVVEEQRLAPVIRF
ncbi:MAG: hypothetical protein AAGI71_05780 [Bacteroidota bacterium]